MAENTYAFGLVQKGRADLGFGGEYGMYHSLYDDFYWMKHLGDPTFAYHAALARILETIALRLDKADVVPFDSMGYASEIERFKNELVPHAAQAGLDTAILNPISDASTQFSAAALRAAKDTRAASSSPLDPARAKEINHALASVEQALLASGGLDGRPWYKHVIFAPGRYAGHAAEVMPGVSEALDRKDSVALRHEVDSVAAALRGAAARLDEVAGLASSSN